MKLSHILSVAAGLCLLSGCVSAPKTYSTVLEGMSRNNLRYWFGEPLRIEHPASGGEDWYYRFSSWQSRPVDNPGLKEDYGQQQTVVSGGLQFYQRIEDLPVHISPDGFVIPPVPKGKVVKN
jgi:hypothetical protein